MKQQDYTEKNTETLEKIIYDNFNEIQELQKKSLTIHQKLMESEKERDELTRECDRIKDQIAEKERYIQYTKILMEAVIPDRKEEN